MKYEIKREVTLVIEADSRAEAIKGATAWKGASFWATFDHAGDWNRLSRHISAKLVKTIPIKKGK